MWYEHRDDHGTVTWLHERETRKDLRDHFTGVLEDHRRSFDLDISIRRRLRNIRLYRKMQGGSWRQVSYGARGRTWVPKEEVGDRHYYFGKENWGVRGPEARKGHQTA